MDIFKQLISGRSGKPSMMRSCTGLYVISVCFCFTYLTIKNGAFPIISDSVIAGVVGSLFAKGYQTGKEQNPTNQ